MISDYDAKLHRDKVQAMVRQKIGDKTANEHLAGLMADKEIKVIPKSMKLLKTKLKEILTRKAGQFDQMNSMQLSEREVQQIEKNFWGRRNEVLAKVDGQKITIADFMGMLNYIPYEAVQRSFKTVMDYALRDFVITNEAKQMGLADKYPEVKLKTGLYVNYLLQNKLKRGIVSAVKLTDEDINNYLQEYKLKSVPEEIDPNIEKQFLNDKRRKAVSDFVKDLRNKVEIKKNVKLVHDYYDNIIKQ